MAGCQPACQAAAAAAAVAAAAAAVVAVAVLSVSGVRGRVWALYTHEHDSNNNLCYVKLLVRQINNTIFPIYQVRGNFLCDMSTIYLKTNIMK